MRTYAKLIDGLDKLGMHKMQEYLPNYIEMVNKGEKTIASALEELVSVELENKQLRALNACVKVANFPFLKTMQDFDFPLLD